MSERRLQRRLTTILAADVCEYSRRVEVDEEQTLRSLEGLLDRWQSIIAGARGRIFHRAGDGVLAEFEHPEQAVRAAIRLQDVDNRHSDVTANDRLQVRVGLSFGSAVVQEDGNLLGQVVNLAARLEQYSAPGEILASPSVLEKVGGDSLGRFASIGMRRLKNLEPIEVFRITPRNSDAQADAPAVLRQTVEYCSASDGTRLAFASMGNGFPVVKTANWLTHIEYDLDSFAWRHQILKLARDFRLIRYDTRGMGLSDRDPPNVSFEQYVDDLEAVVDASGLERFALLGYSQGAAIATAYAARHPERVVCLGLMCGYARGWRKRFSPEEVEREEAFLKLIETGWDDGNPAVRQLFTSLFVPDATPEDMKAHNEFAQKAVTGAAAAANLYAVANVDLRPILGKVQAPTMVFQVTGDALNKFEEAEILSEGIPHAELVPLEGRNHLVMEHDKVWPEYWSRLEQFLHKHAVNS